MVGRYSVPGTRFEVQGAQLVNASDEVADAGRDAGFGGVEDGVLDQIAFQVSGLAVFAVKVNLSGVMALALIGIKVGVDRAELIRELNTVLVVNLVKLRDEAGGLQVKLGVPLGLVTGCAGQGYVGVAGRDETPFDAVREAFRGGKGARPHRGFRLRPRGLHGE